MKITFPVLFSAALLAAAPSLSQESPMNIPPAWEFVADTVMGGVSSGQINTELVQGRTATRLTGTVSLENNGGFVQMALDLSPGGGPLYASSYSGIELHVIGNGEVYDLRLRTDALERPWQSFRTDFIAASSWATIRIPFTEFQPHKTDATFDPARLHRLGVLAIGRAFDADVAVASLRFYQ